MKILAIGDFHGKFPKKFEKLAENVDLILSTGDYGGSNKLLKIIFKNLGKDWTDVVGEKKAEKYTREDYNSGKKVINKLGKLGTHVYAIHGNWDFEGRRLKERWGNLNLVNYSSLMKKIKNITFLRRGTFKNLFGLKLFSFGGVLVPYINTTPEGLKTKREYHTIKEKKQWNKVMSKGRKDIDIFLAHYTPYGHFDKVKYKGYNPMNGKHVGVRVYTDFIKKFQPRLFVCGHMHEYQGMKKVGNTIIVATGSAEEGKAAIIEIHPNKKSKIKVKFIK